MRQGKRLTRQAKIQLDKLGHNPEQYALVRSDDRQLEVRHKETGEQLTLPRR